MWRLMSKQSESPNKRRRYRKSEYGEIGYVWPEFQKRKVYFLHDDLVMEYHRNRAMGVVTVDNLTKGRKETMTFADFKRMRKRAYTITEAAHLLDINRDTITRCANNGTIPKPIGRLLNGEQKKRGPAYYSEKHLYIVRENLAAQHRGRPRKDGRTTNNMIPTEQELRAAINNHYFLYLKDADGEYMPVFDTR